MKKVFRVIGYALLVLLVALGALLTYIKFALPDIKVGEKLTIDKSPENVERGRYLASSVTVCVDCHSTRDWTRFSAPLIPGTLGKGGELFDRSFGFPGSYRSANITPVGISRYTDEELYRVITTGVTKEGRAMFPVMPYPYYGKMDPEDIKSIIAYIRSLQPVYNIVPASVSDFPMNFIINTIPKVADPHKRPDPSNRHAYGAYLVNAAGCIECHTKADKGQIIKDLAFSGGREFNMPDGSVIASANITSDGETGIGDWNEDAFVNRFKGYVDSLYKPQVVEKGSFNTIMPWTMYGKMTREDLGAIYTYLHSIEGIRNPVTKFTPPPLASKG
ncbi:MAG: cytochrome c [Taibaiella sp.]|nr:cytochrome c [Taibaiella sp.]